MGGVNERGMQEQCALGTTSSPPAKKGSGLLQKR